MRILYACVCIFLFIGWAHGANAKSVSERLKAYFQPEWHGFFTPCNGNCAVGIYGGVFLDTGLEQIVGIRRPFVPVTNLEFNDDFLLGVTASKRFLTLANHVHLELEVGAAQRFGIQDEQEFWVAPYIRYDGFFWNKYLYTSVAINTGLSISTGVSDVEEARGGSSGGDNLLHFLSPEITFALPERKDIQATFRLHHRSGAYGVISNTRGGAQYLTFGVRKFF
ncbi:MAG: hypothetical protein ABJK39_13275 [Hyphomicrobiales bacterium]